MKKQAFRAAASPRVDYPSHAEFASSRRGFLVQLGALLTTAVAAGLAMATEDPGGPAKKVPAKKAPLKKAARRKRRTKRPPVPPTGGYATPIDAPIDELTGP